MGSTVKRWARASNRASRSDTTRDRGNGLPSGAKALRERLAMAPTRGLSARAPASSGSPSASAVRDWLENITPAIRRASRSGRGECSSDTASRHTSSMLSAARACSCSNSLAVASSFSSR